MMKKIPRILIVDDEVEFVALLKTTLEDKSYKVITAGNRRQAEDMVRSEEPDVIVLGTIMPRGEAFLLHQWLKQSLGFSNVPMMVVNAAPKEQLTKGWRLEEGLQCDAEDFLSKPIEPEAVLPRIKRLLDKKAGRRIRVLVADDHAVVRDGIRAVLTLQRDMQVVGEAVDGKDALKKAIDLRPDVVLMDIVMPVMNGIEATREICKEYKQAKILVLTQYDDDENIKASREAGALGFISKADASRRLLSGIRSVARGEEFIRSLTRD